MIKQIGKFGLVGLIASFCHGFVFMLLRSELLLGKQVSGEQISNLIAFLFAFMISWAGHYFWTFQSGDKKSLIRFLIVALIGYGLNAFFVWLVITHFAFPNIYVLPFILMVTPMASFMLARFWAFRVR